MDGNERGDGESRMEWSPSPVWTRAGIEVGRVVAFLLFVVGYLCDVAAIGSVAPVFFIPTLLIAGPVGRIVHESGRCVAARRSGMIVAAVRIGPVDIAPRRKGWKLRWKRYIHPLPAGYVYALPDPSRPLRTPMIRFALGGVVATLAFATLVALSIPFFQTEIGRWSTAAIVAVLLVPLSSLFPNPLTLGNAILEPAGVMAWRWWKHPPADPWMARALASSRMLRGTPISALDLKDTSTLIDESVGGVWFAVKRHQQLGEWALAAGQGDRLDRSIPTHRYAKSAFAELIDITRSEIAFSAAVVHRDPIRLPLPDSLRRARWGDSPLAARCEAWRAHLAGDGDVRRRASEQCLRIAERSVDRSLVASERLIAEQLYGEG